MDKRNVTATVQIEVELLDLPAEGDLRELVEERLEKRLTLLDIKGGRTGEDGSVTRIFSPDIQMEF